MAASLGHYWVVETAASMESYLAVAMVIHLDFQKAVEKAWKKGQWKVLSKVA